jgi:hypothetical protein
MAALMLPNTVLAHLNAGVRAALGPPSEPPNAVSAPQIG